MREEKKAGTKIVDVDGSYLHRKQQSSGVPHSDYVTLPDIPLIGWESIDGMRNLDGVPKVTHGEVEDTPQSTASSANLFKSPIHLPCRLYWKKGKEGAFRSLQ